MVTFQSPITNNSRQTNVLMVTWIASWFLVSEGLLCNPKTPLTNPYNQLSSSRSPPLIPIRSSAECQSKRDPSLEIDEDDDSKEKQTSQERSPEYESNDVDFRMGDDSNRNFEDSNAPAQNILPAIFATLLFVSFWPLLALLRSTTSPIEGFDIDMFMALKGILDTAPDNMDPTTIVELPSLSPAEQLVGAIFGPPR